MRIVMVAALIGSLGVVSSTPSLADSEAQRAYDACVHVYNSKYRHLDGYKAIVAGLSSGGSKCFWTWNAPTLGDAISSAMSSCERERSKCYLYADSNGNSSWSRRISDMGGNDGTRGSSNAAAGAFVEGMLGGFLNGLGAAGVSPGVNSGGGSANCPGATIAVDENCRPLH